jgi:hypothetical protein
MQEEVRRAVPRTITRKKTLATWTSSRGVAPQKPNHRTPLARFTGGQGFRRHLLSWCSVHIEVWDGENQRATEMWYLSEANQMTEGIRVLILSISGKRTDQGRDQETEGGEKTPTLITCRRGRRNGETERNSRYQIFTYAKTEVTPAIITWVDWVTKPFPSICPLARRLPATPRPSRQRRARVWHAYGLFSTSQYRRTKSNHISWVTNLSNLVWY